MPRLIATLFIVSVLVMSCGNASEIEPPVPIIPQEASGLTLDPTPVETDSLSRETHVRMVSSLAGQNHTVGELVQLIATDLVGLPYRDHMLDQTNEETLIVSLEEFDCVLFVEVVVALAQAIEVGATDFDMFAANVERLRYRDGLMGDYCSRLHYFSDWLYDNDRRGTIELFTGDLPAATPFDKHINFMTGNRSSYPRLVGNDEAFACIGDMERDLNTRAFYYVPQERITDVYEYLEAGDVIALTTTVGGLDVAHTGFVYKHADGRTGFIHASTTGQVRIENDLASYVQGIRIQNGMMVARPQPVLR